MRRDETKDKVMTKDEVRWAEEVKKRIIEDPAFRLQVTSALILCASDPLAMLDNLRPAIASSERNGRMPTIFVRLAALAVRERTQAQATSTSPAQPQPTQPPTSPLLN